MSLDALTHVWKKSKARGVRLLVLLSLADFAGDEGECFPSIETLARKSRVHPNTARNALRWLVEVGELEVLRERAGRPTVYRIKGATRRVGVRDLHPFLDVGTPTSADVGTPTPADVAEPSLTVNNPTPDEISDFLRAKGLLP